MVQQGGQGQQFGVLVGVGKVCIKLMHAALQRRLHFTCSMNGTSLR